MENKTYTLELNEKQLRTVQQGLEFYSRFLSGQWVIPLEMVHNEYVDLGKPDEFWSKRNITEEALRLAKNIFLSHLHGNESYGIGSSKLHESAKIAYDIYRPILEQFSKEYNEEHPEEEVLSVYDSEGLSYSKEGRIKIKVKYEESKS